MDLKPATTFDEQLQKLKDRNCYVSDPVFCKKILQQISYYRFTAYFLPFRKPDGDYVAGTSFHRVYRIYEFDRKMRQVLFSAIEQVELSLRARLAYYFSHKYGPEGYMLDENYNKKHDHEKFIALFNQEIKNNKKVLFVQHHLTKYEGRFPLWVATELFSFGMLSHFYGDMKLSDQKCIAKEEYRTTPQNLRSWLRCCTDLRNICAHYGRLYFRKFSAIPATPEGFPITLDRGLFDNVMVLRFLYPDVDRWNHEVLVNIMALIEEYRGDILLSHIGFPDNWEELLRKV